jgi:hypothetical protein
MRNRMRARLLRRLVLGFAVALVAVPAAQAYPDEGPKQQTSVQSAVVQGDVKDGIGTAAVLAELDATTRAYVAGAASTPQQLELAAKTREYVAGAAPVAPEIQVVSTSDGFDWGDAGVGAGTVAAVMLLGAGALLATRHIHRPASV